MSKLDSLYLTEAEQAARVGLPLDEWKEVASTLEKAGFPTPEPLFRGRRYWPACKAFLDRRYQLGSQSLSGTPALDGEERWNEAQQTPARRRA